MSFLRVDVDAQKAIAAKYQISAMPTFLAIKAGKVVDTVRNPKIPRYSYAAHGSGELTHPWLHRELHS